MRFVICDDEQTAINILQDQFDQRPELAIEYDAYTSGEALLAAYKNGALRCAFHRYGNGRDERHRHRQRHPRHGR